MSNKKFSGHCKHGNIPPSCKQCEDEREKRFLDTNPHLEKDPETGFYRIKGQKNVKSIKMTVEGFEALTEMQQRACEAEVALEAAQQWIRDCRDMLLTPLANTENEFGRVAEGLGKGVPALTEGMGKRTTHSDAERLARKFHDTYERLAPKFGRTSQKSCSAVWEDLPMENRALMIATCEDLLQQGVL